jgi:hypothetical protein
MSTHKPQGTDVDKNFDLAIISFGHKTIIVPKKAALAVFEACQGQDVYDYKTKWEEGESRGYVKLLDTEDMPTLRTIGPAHFYQALQNQKMLEERERAEKAMKKL